MLDDGVIPARIPVETVESGKRVPGLIIHRANPATRLLMDTPWTGNQTFWPVTLPQRVERENGSWKIRFFTAKISTATLNQASQTPIVGSVPVGSQSNVADYTGQFAAFD